MAGCKLIWILAVSALVGCVLIGAEENNQDASKELISKLMNKTSKQKEEILGTYENVDVEIFGKTVEVWAGLCKVSPQRCSIEEFDRVRKISTSKLSSYTRHCKAKLRMFCNEHFDEVVEHFADNEDRKLMASLVQYYEEAVEKKVQGDDKNPLYEDPMRYFILRAYSKLREERKGQNISFDELAFEKKVKHVAAIYRKFAHLLAELGESKIKNIEWYDTACSFSELLR